MNMIIELYRINKIKMAIELFYTLINMVNELLDIDKINMINELLDIDNINMINEL